MTTNSNMRGYAFVALKGPFKRQMKWQQYAAAMAYGYHPHEYDYINQGLDLFDRMYTVATHDTTDATLAYANEHGSYPTMDELGIYVAHDIVNTVIKAMGKSITDDVKGRFSYPVDDDGTQRMEPKFDLTLDSTALTGDGEVTTKGDMIPVEEEGYTALEDADLMRMRMRLISKRLRPEDLKVLTSYVDGTHDSMTAACGGDKTTTVILMRRIRRALGSLEGSIAFG